jgi:hypothetical protein
LFSITDDIFPEKHHIFADSKVASRMIPSMIESRPKRLAHAAVGNDEWNGKMTVLPRLIGNFRGFKRPKPFREINSPAAGATPSMWSFMAVWSFLIASAAHDSSTVSSWRQGYPAVEAWAARGPR